MVLLETIMGNVFVHKVCTICLLEANFNWWNKLIFAKCMMQQTIQNGSIPQECYAKKYSHCNNAVLTKQFFCDSSCVLHHPARLGECNFGDCYDRAAHPPTSMALQSWGIPKPAIRVFLNTIQTMQYVLKTGFRESPSRYGGTSTAPNSGLQQGSGASPPRIYGPEFPNCQCILPNGTQCTSSLFLLTATVSSCCSHLRRQHRFTPLAFFTLYQSRQASGTCPAGHVGLRPYRHSIWRNPEGEEVFDYLLDYKYMHGHAQMKLLSDLPAPRCYIAKDGKMLLSHILIPQPEGPDLPIVTHDIHTASKIPGVHFLQQET